MSWFSKNYEKAALGGAVVVALGLGYLGWSKIGAVESDFPNPLSGAGKGDPAVAGADLIPKAEQSIKIDRTWTKGIDPDGERPVDLFTGVPLVIKSSEPDKAIDPIEDAPIHDPIPNTWWLDNRIDPGFADSPGRDPDGDGFSNLEEFQAKTDPNNPKSVPAQHTPLKPRSSQLLRLLPRLHSFSLVSSFTSQILLVSPTGMKHAKIRVEFPLLYIVRKLFSGLYEYFLLPRFLIEGPWFTFRFSLALYLSSRLLLARSSSFPHSLAFILVSLFFFSLLSPISLLFKSFFS